MENNAIQPAQRLQSVEEYYFSRKLKEVAGLNAQGLDIISLAIGSPDMPPSDKTIETLCQVAHNPKAHGYQPTMGTAELREAMSEYYGRVYGVEVNAQNEVLPLIGSKEGVLHITLAFVNPGEKVLVPDPGYPTYTSLSRLLGAEIVNYNLREELSWQPDFDELEQMDLTGVRLMWTNYPHMPTGGRAMRQTYERLIDFGRRHQIVIVNDNPYSRILSTEHLSILQVEGAKQHCIELNSLSKSHNMPGWRVGMLITNSEWLSWILKVKSNIDSGTFRGLQLAAAEALRNNTEEWHTEYNINVYKERRALAEEIMTMLGCRFDPQQVGMFLWGRIPDALPSAETLTEKVLHEARVFITPGFIFGSNGNRYVRISLCASAERMREAIERIKKSPL